MNVYLIATSTLALLHSRVFCHTAVRLQYDSNDKSCIRADIIRLCFCLGDI